MSEAPGSPASSESSLRVLALIGYGLLIVAPANGVTAIAGVVLAYIKRGEARGTPYESHFRNMIRLFWTGVIVVVAVLAAAGYGVIDLLATNAHPSLGVIAILPAIWFALVAFLVWYLFRAVTGLVRALDGRAYR